MYCAVNFNYIAYSLVFIQIEIYITNPAPSLRACATLPSSIMKNRGLLHTAVLCLVHHMSKKKDRGL